MSPKAVSETEVLTRTAWSRDVRPNTPGVTYSRRSYYYDREFSDSIVRPTDGFESSLSGRSTATRCQEQASGLKEEYNNALIPPIVVQGNLFQSTGRLSKRPRESSDWRFEDPFQRGRVLQSATAGDHGNEDWAQSQVPAAAIPTEQSEPRLTIARLDLQTLARTVVVAADIIELITDVYQRIRDSDGRGGDGEDEGADDDEFFGLNPDPYHLEAGPPRRLRPLSRIPPRRTLPARKTVAQVGTASATTRAASAMDRTQGNNSCQSSNATATMSSLPPLPAGKRICYYLIATVAFGVLASFGLALWWAQSQGDVSAGFTIGGYVIAVDALVVAVVGVVHRSGCRCWKT
ncbi:hypothetical protein F5B21DRAFT_238354 [Xylaria acuta]|nr:hypothetical protein F5B21DRAFT_238354 [Xylaria acuta]